MYSPPKGKYPLIVEIKIILSAANFCYRLCTCQSLLVLDLEGAYFPSLTLNFKKGVALTRINAVQTAYNKVITDTYVCEHMLISMYPKSFKYTAILLD